jgi:ATP-dependent DNA helicase RecG
MTIEDRKKPNYHLESPIQYLPGVGPTRAKLFEKLGLNTVYDILYFFPREYLDISTIDPITSLRAGEKATILGRVVRKKVQRTRRGMSNLVLFVEDQGGGVECVWFNQPFREKEFRTGDILLLHGDVRLYNRPQLHPKEWNILQEDVMELDDINAGLIPIYPATQGLSYKFIRRVVRRALELVGDQIEETLPEEILQPFSFPELGAAIRQMHFPDDFSSQENARRRIVFEEFFYLQLILALRHTFRKRQGEGIEFKPVNTLVTPLYKGLPFQLTDAQKRVIREIFEDMGSPLAMNRLLQGDVGSGKTIVSLFTMLRAVENGYQAALMAPTEILAEQHRRKLSVLLAGLDVRLERLTGSLDTKEKERIQDAIAAGDVPLVVGTHALIQEAVSFNNLGVVIVDEQHRFGVSQRVSLMEKGKNPDCLVMTATPIPRSLALTLYGDLDLSIIDEMPPGREPVVTRIIDEERRDRLYKFVRDRVGEGERVFVVFPLVEESDKLDLKDAMTWEKKYRDEIFPDLRVGLVHGRLKGDEKDKIMRQFEAGNLDILVSTTVIEVGVDMPEASVMVVEHAERFGLSQLHQLRGRVGRGDRKSYCMLFVSDDVSSRSIERLNVLEKTNDGFRVAEEDLRIRGPGEFLGTRQHGVPELRIASLVDDRMELDLARREAFRIIRGDPELKKTENNVILKELSKRYRDKVKNIRIG